VSDIPSVQTSSRADDVDDINRALREQVAALQREVIDLHQQLTAASKSRRGSLLSPMLARSPPSAAAAARSSTPTTPARGVTPVPMDGFSGVSLAPTVISTPERAGGRSALAPPQSPSVPTQVVIGRSGSSNSSSLGLGATRGDVTADQDDVKDAPSRTKSFLAMLRR
jgi:hypothetical protein